MKKIIRTLLPVLALTAAVGAQAANAEQSDPREMVESTVKVRQVNYVCQQGKRLTVKYGFNKQNYPTYAEAFISGKSRLMPINLHHSDNFSTHFGDENNFSLMSHALTLNNYHKPDIDVQVQAPGSEITHKNCKAKSARRIKG